MSDSSYNTDSAMGANSESAIKGRRYTDKEKKDILAYADKIDAEKGRGGMSAAVKKYGVSILTIGSWRKQLGKGEPKKARPRSTTPVRRKASSAVAGSITERAERILDLAKEIDAKEDELSKLRMQFDQLKVKL